MIEILIFFTGVSILFYILLGGADYGAGVLEIFKGRKLREKQSDLINHAMGPVWEANHIWLILLIVILFMGFPRLFVLASTYLHIPIVFVLLGIVLRGCAFTFRHYDAVKDRSQEIYTWIFSLSSVWTPFWLGVTAASFSYGKLTVDAPTYYELYIAPWYGLYPFSFGVFVIFIFTFLASVYLIGESKTEELKKIFQIRAMVSHILTVIAGVVVFVASYFENVNLHEEFFTSPLSLTCFILATLLFVPLWWALLHKRNYTSRIVSGAMVSLVLFGWYDLHYPFVLIGTDFMISFHDAAAPKATLKQLVIALVFGSLLIFPSLFYLFKIFKTKKKS
jgi:cytochrome bd ubiquinol oxidase subunit II